MKRPTRHRDQRCGQCDVEYGGRCVEGEGCRTAIARMLVLGWLEATLRTPDGAAIGRILLSPRTKQIAAMRWGLPLPPGSTSPPGPMTYERVGEHFAVTRERIRQILLRGAWSLWRQAMDEEPWAAQIEAALARREAMRTEQS